MVYNYVYINPFKDAYGNPRSAEETEYIMRNEENLEKPWLKRSNDYIKWKHNEKRNRVQKSVQTIG